MKIILGAIKEFNDDALIMARQLGAEGFHFNTPPIATSDENYWTERSLRWLKEYTEKFEMALETFAPAEDYITIEEGNLSGMIHPMVNTEKGGEICKEELVSVSMSVPEGWNPGTTETDGNIHSIYFKMPQNKNNAIFWIYKDSDTTHDDFLANHSLWVGIDEHTYREVSGNFEKGSYIHFDYPAFEKYDHEDFSL